MSTLYKVGTSNAISTTISSSLTSSETSAVTLSDTTGLQAPGIIVIDRVDPNSLEETPTLREYIGFTSIVGFNLTGLTRGLGDSTAQQHNAGAIVEEVMTVDHWNDLRDIFITEHNEDGTHDSALVTSLKATGAEVTTGTEDAKIVTPKALADSGIIKSTDGTFASNSDNKIPTEKATKTYVDSISNSYTGIYSNALINPLFDVWQSLNAGSSVTPNDDVYIADIWNTLTETNSAWTYSKSTDAPTGFGNSLKCVCAIANNQMGLVQFIENVNTKNLAGQTVSLSFYAKTTTAKTIDNLRATVLAWNSTADTITSDVIGTWASDGTDPTFATNWTKEVAGSNKALTTSWQRFTITGISLDTASTANLAVVVWVDDGTIAANDEFFITGVQLNIGSTVLPFSPRSFDIELQLVQRFYEQSWPHGAAQVNSEICHASNTNGYIYVYPSVRKRTNMSTSNVAIYDGTTLNQVRNTNTGGTVGSLTFDGVGVAKNKMAALYDLSAFTANTAYDYNWVVDQRL